MHIEGAISKALNSTKLKKLKKLKNELKKL